MSHERVVFLDFDGVLVHEGYSGEPDETRFWSELNFDPEAIAVLNALCAQSGAGVVISSSWRRNHGLDELRDMLRRRGFEGVVLDVTPSLDRGTDGVRLERGHEIQAWLNEHPEVLAFVILDDDAEMAHLRPFHVQSNMTSGLRPQHLEPALACLRSSAKSLVATRR